MASPLAWENGQRVDTVDFDYAAIDGEQSEPESVDESFWRMQGELFGEILRWLTIPKTLEGIGARVKTLCLYLNPTLIEETSLTEIKKLEGAPCGAALSKALLSLQGKFDLHPSYFQKASYLRDVFRRSAVAVHAERKAKLNGNAKVNGNGAHLKDSKEYLKAENERLKAEMEETKANSLPSVKEFASKGGKAHRGTAFAKQRAKRAAKARWKKSKR
jgi:hypothetical protein